MKEATAVFIGHNDCYGIDREYLKREIEHLINSGVELFLSGGMGGFDMLCAHIIYDLKTKYPHIKSVIVIPYLDFSIFNEALFDNSEFPECLEGVPKRAAIPRRNQYMVQNARYAVCYVRRSYGGAANSYSYAMKKGCKMIEIPNLK